MVGAISQPFPEAQDEWDVCGAAVGRLRSSGSEGSTDLGSEQCLSDDDPDTFSFSAEETIFLFDWDDTVMPTAWLTGQGLLHEGAVVSEEQRSKLAALTDHVAVTLKAACQHGKVVVITNAAEGWVQQSCLYFMPAVAPILASLRIISARSAFEPLGIRSATEWKVRAFEREVELAFSDAAAERGLRPNVVSIGDSQHEHQALLRATSGLRNCCAKSLKFAEHPSIEQLVEEHALVAGTLEDVVQYDGDLDVDVGGAV